MVCLREVVAPTRLSADASGYLPPYFLVRISRSLTCLRLTDVSGWLSVHGVSSPEEWDYIGGAITLFPASRDDPIGYIVLPETSREFLETRIAVVSLD